jgi:hypothetical protein
VSITTAHAAVMAAERAEYVRTRDERVRQHVDRLIAWALDLVERVNLAGGGPCPYAVGDLIVHLQLLADVRPVRPATSHEAHEALLELMGALLGLPCQ